MEPIVSSEHFEILEEKPSKKYLKSLNYPMYMEERRDGKNFWILFKSAYGSRLYDYLFSKKEYKAKEKLFGIDDEGYFVVGNEDDFETNPDFLQYRLLRNWKISDKKAKRILKVVVSNKNVANDPLLHTLYLKTRAK
ncbi:MAG: hypothetical protein UT34_C0001G0286 [candidate division WS6 bacterium GW2011_GWF2_39_15]|uniref:Uncharacterized protein n=1 Tax=candidate division WS6 bacterium GW2011_GWF2_39_15 TaxID=1619100 RepID=A0A0G0N0A0_9BACT|nr:MAG: hypothetical protein UT34_C0001G0286 [candidate division WS6 bacterium GW2011_GWF2_39_15]